MPKFEFAEDLSCDVLFTTDDGIIMLLDWTLVIPVDSVFDLL